MSKPSLALIWSPESESDLLEIWRWGAQQFSIAIADKHLRDIYASADNLLYFPNLGQARNDLLPHLRSIVIYPTVLFYRIYNNTIEIVRVVDGRRNLAAMFVRDV